MYAELIRCLRLALMLLPALSTAAPAGEASPGQSPAVGVPAISAVSPPALPRVPPPMPVGAPMGRPSVAPTLSPGETVAAGDGAPLPGVLRQIGERQTELTLLELEIKRAELQHKLRELDAPPPSLPPPGPSLAGDAVSKGNPDPSGPGSRQPVVRRIHKLSGELVALVILPTGEVREVRRGAVLAHDLKVVEIRPEAVRVSRSGQTPYDLGIWQGAGEGGLP